MKTTIIRVPEMTMEDFADKHNLHMVVTERKVPDGVKDRFYARFEHVEISEGCILRGAYGDGVSPEAAIYAYGEAISLKKIIYDAMGKNRKEIEVPRIVRGAE
jgi:hypothetical protein